MLRLVARSGTPGALFRLAALPLLLTWVAGCADAPRAEAGASADRPVVATDDAGREVRLPRPARRVVSLLPAGTETLFALGAGEQVVGRTRYDTDSAVAHLPSVGGGLDPSLEALVALRPDLVVAWEPAGGSDVRRRLEALGIPVYAVATRDTAAIFHSIRGLGRLTGRDPAADSLLGRIRAQFDSVRASVPPGPRPRVLYVISLDPPIVSGTDNFLFELLGVAGADPIAVAAEQTGRSPQVSVEEILRLQPDVLMLPVGEDPALSLQRLRTEPGWRGLRAVQGGRVATVPALLVHRPGPRIGAAAQRMRAALESVR